MTALPSQAAAASPVARWTAVHVGSLAVGLLVAAAIRLLLLPTPGLRGDLDQFVVWAQGVITMSIGRAYESDISFPPVMVYLWTVLGAVEPGLRSSTDAGDTMVRAVMKAPASLADLGLAAGVAWALRARPTWAVAAALAIALHPAVIDVSAWWGQYESLYVLAALVAYLLAVGDRPAWAAMAMAVALMTKPQALPLLAPFAGWYLGRYGTAAAFRYGLIGAAVVVLLWLPFIPNGGPGEYLRNVAEYQGGIFAVLSLRAWNPWWLLQEAAGYGEFIADTARIAGPVTLRVVGYLAALVLETVVFLAVLRSPTPRSLALGLAAATLVAFTMLTSMHERYAYAALIFLALLLPDPRILTLWLSFSVAFTLNLLAAVPPTPEIGRALPVFGPLGILGSVVMTGCAAVTLALLLAGSRARATESPAESDRVPAQVVG